MTGTTAAGRPAAETSLARSSRVMALGTVVSRATGFLRTAVLGAALGIGFLGDAYNVANTTPNILYDLLLGGILTSVVVPLLVRAATHDEDGGEAYAQRFLTLVMLGLSGTTLLAVLAAPLIVRLYVANYDAGELALTTTFARFFLPQIVFYGVGATLGAILNTRHRFAAPMWAPVLNNLVVIATGLLFWVMVRGHTGPLVCLTTTQTLVLGLGTTAGIVVQTVALLPSLRAAGFRFRPRWDLRNADLGEVTRLAGWVLLYVAASQAALLVIVKLATAAGGAYPGRGYTAYMFGFTLFQLPHAIVAVSVITALLPRMSRHAAQERFAAVRADLGTGLRLAAVALLPAAVLLLVLGVPIATAVFAHGRTTLSGARFIGVVLAAFAVGLVPFSFFQLQLRVFYALRDTRTPALINLAVSAVNVALGLLLFAVLPERLRVVGLALGYSAAYAVGLAACTAVLRRRLNGLDAAEVVRTIVRLLLAAVLAGVAAELIAVGCRRLLGVGVGTAMVTVTLAATAGGAVYLAAALRMRVEEVGALVAAVRRRIAR